MKNKFAHVLYALLTLTLVTIAAGCGQSGSSRGGREYVGKPGQAIYHCPMHPAYTSDKPGDCPICNMKLVLVKDYGAEARATPSRNAATAKADEYACPDHPDYVFGKPGLCGICDRQLVPLKGNGLEAGAAKPADVPGRVAVAISPEKQQLIGLRTTVVARRELSQIIRTTGIFEHDETKLARIAPRFSGWVRRLHVNSTGQPVEKGDPLFTVYSPELLSAESEYLLASQRLEQLKTNNIGQPIESAQRLVESARRRLALWEIGDAEIHSLETSGQAQDELLIRSPVSGHVISKTAIEGKAFMAGEALYEIGELSRLWLRASIHEFELALVKIGQKARVILPLPGRTNSESVVAFIYPHIDPQTRRAEVRLEVDNPRHELRPGMWASVEIDVSFGEVLTVPASAVIDTGTRGVAFVLREDNHLEPREVKIGVKTDDWWEVQTGVMAGERVVTRALFLVDAESQLKSAISGMTGSTEHQH